ncbi:MULTISPECIES: hypothetical protein [Chryseobacterium]|uniref:TonB C-terminal domain-containing protein n=1 Tax=Chryseobacterium taihuense TaxID=1141221 RepID=A0A4U8WCD3_9FLAO|nr:MULTISPECIES: hypothetical protein [Chryseobacterium]QQV02692.1 hypothetical protein I6I61_16760 [Chryseobacterium sp. FDAARGOS 1104]VFB04047.1 Uncharacterised protein [Chryseobacterium taihuense]
MKTLTFLLALITANLTYSQVLDERDDSFMMENNKNLLKIDIKEPFMQVAVKGCSDFKPASFEGGAAAYKEILRKYMYTFLNSDFYTLTGEFTFTLTIDAMGKVVDIAGDPKVLNSEVFFDDMQYVVRRIKTNWTPAMCNGEPVKSEMKLKMNFSSLSSDM